MTLELRDKPKSRVSSNCIYYVVIIDILDYTLRFVKRFL